MNAPSSRSPAFYPLLFAAVLWSGSSQAGEKIPDPSPASDLRPRVPWTISRFQGTPDPAPPYAVEVAFPNLRFQRPGTLSSAPGTERLFVVEVEGRVYSFPNNPDCDKADLFFDVKAHVPNLSQVYGMAFHPDFAKNRYVYLCYILQGTDPDGTKIARFTVRDTEPPSIDPASEQVIITFLAGGHNGCCLKFGLDGYLYISTGDGTGPSPPDIYKTGQDCSDLLCSILRIDVDQSNGTQNYAVPPDNPFVGMDGIRPEIWAYGFRNPWKMSFDRKTGDLWVGDVGWESWELVDRVVKGGNYGWSIVEGDQPVFPDDKVGPTPILPPTVQHPHSEARSITGGYVYHGERLPELRGAYIYGDWSTGKIWALRHDGKQVESLRELTDSTLQIVDFAETSAGELFILDYETTGQIYRLISNPDRSSGEQFPRTLTASGLFRSVKDHTLADGVVPFCIKAPMWQDGITSERFLALPADGQLEFLTSGEAKFPPGSVLGKTIYAPPSQSEPRRRWETQILHFENESWRPYSYVWNIEQTEATLVGAGGMNVDDRLAGRDSRTWRVASRSECMLCHTAYLGSVLAVNVPQLDREQSYQGKIHQQLSAWEAMQILKTPLATDPQALPRLTDPSDTAAPLVDRARTYLHANCQHCHRPNGGGTSTIHLTAGIPLEQMQILDARPALGSLGIPDGRVVTAGDPYRSVLFVRMSKLGAGHMPHVGTSDIDELGLSLVHDWILGLPVNGAEAGTRNRTETPSFDDVSANARRGAIEKVIATVPGAVQLAYQVADGALKTVHREEVIATALASDNPLIRDLFERFLPMAQRQSRLGDVIETESLLARTGDAKRGRDLFQLGTTVQCRSCHRIHGNGGDIGPDLSEIGKRLSKAELLESILTPSKKIEERYRTHVAVTADGATVTGLVVQRSDEEITLREADGKLRVIPRHDLEALRISEQSLMPDKLLRDLTAKDAADLLDYLSSLR